MDNALNQNSATEVPPWERGHKLLDTLRDEMHQRLSEIDAKMNRLVGEREALLGVLNRIGPAAQTVMPPPAYPQPVTAEPAYHRY